MDTPSRGTTETSCPNLSLWIDGSTATARLHGEIDSLVSDDVRILLAAALVSVSRLDLHLDEVTFMDSSGIAMLLDIHTCAAANEVVVRLLKPTPMLVRLFTLTRLHDRFDIH